MKDGLYHVTNSYLSASFELKDGKLIMCAPILRRRLDYWMTKAKRIR